MSFDLLLNSILKMSPVSSKRKSKRLEKGKFAQRNFIEEGIRERRTMSDRDFEEVTEKVERKTSLGSKKKLIEIKVFYSKRLNEMKDQVLAAQATTSVTYNHKLNGVNPSNSRDIFAISNVMSPVREDVKNKISPGQTGHTTPIVAFLFRTKFV